MARLAWVARYDFESSAALFSPDVEYSDGRNVVSLPPMTGIVAMGEMYQSTFTVYDDLRIEPAAVRGDRLALFTVRASAESGFELTAYMLERLDQAGRIDELAIFDDTDLTTALEALDRQHLEMTDDVAAVERVVLAAYEALNQRDWESFAACCDDELVVADHRLLGFPDGKGASTFVWALQQLVEQVPDVVAYVTKLQVSGQVAVVTTYQRGTAPEGSEAAWDFHTVVALGPRGRITRHEYFDADRWVDALTVFDEWSNEPDPRDA
jgi:hypothetical protein